MIGSPAARAKAYARLVAQSQGPAAILFETIREVIAAAVSFRCEHYTSDLAQSKRHELWLNCLKRAPVTVCGTRQAVFLPNLEVLVVDEPDRFGYRNDQQPTYHTLSVARWRSANEQTRLIVGTPSLSLELAAMVAGGARLLGHGPTSPITTTNPREVNPSTSDLVVHPSAAYLGSFPQIREVHIGQVEYLRGHWPRVWFVGFDELMAIPEFNQQEKLYLKIQRLRWLTDRVAVVTDHPEHPIFKPNFLDHEMALRRQLSFPPFARLIKVTMPDGETQVTKLPLTADLRRVVSSMSLPKGARVAVDPIELKLV